MAYSISAAEANFINETARYDIDVMQSCGFRSGLIYLSVSASLNRLIWYMIAR